VKHSNIVEIVQFSADRKLLACSACGAGADASCNCGVPYVPAAARAAEAIGKTPQKSNRSIAGDLGVDEKTVRRARRSTADKSAVEKRVGRDGRIRRLPAKGRAVTGPPIEAEIKAAHKRFLSLTDEWTDAVLELAASLASARAGFESDEEFDRWAIDRDLYFLSPSECSLLIGLSSDVKRARIALEHTLSDIWHRVEAKQIAVD
jgi:hypothetical protein